MTTIQELADFLEQHAPPAYQEDYDNAGLLVGDPGDEVRGVIICLDSTEAVIEEAVRKGCNLVVAHHPIIFKGIKRLTGRTYVERTVRNAIRHGVAIYAIHTNLDNVYYQGVNARIGERLGLENTRLLAPRRTWKKMTALVPALHRRQIRTALLQAGASHVVFAPQTTFTNLAFQDDGPFDAEYLKVETLFPAAGQNAILRALRESQPDQQSYFDIMPVENESTAVGAGMIGDLSRPMEETDFLRFLQDRLQAGCVRYTRLRGREVRRVAVCGGAGGFLLPQAIAGGADFFVTADYRYHEFFDADGQIVVADIGHYESEQFTIDLLYDIISDKFSTFAVCRTEVNTNPVNYL